VMIVAPRGIWPALRDRLGVRLLDVHRAAPRPARATIPPVVSERVTG